MNQAMGARIAAGAQSMIGVPFRLHGRRADTGLDCVGLVLAALRGAGVPVAEPAPYTVIGMQQERVVRLAEETGLHEADGAAPGDILLARSGPMQLHLMVRSDQGLIHAHAGLGRVVLMPEPAPWPVLRCWRVPEPKGKEG